MIPSIIRDDDEEESLAYLGRFFEEAESVCDLGERSICDDHRRRLGTRMRGILN